jgi:hypothetical protein
VFGTPNHLRQPHSTKSSTHFQLCSGAAAFSGGLLLQGFKAVVEFSSGSQLCSEALNQTAPSTYFQFFYPPFNSRFWVI